MIISPAFAQGAGGADGGFATLLPLVLIFVVFYFGRNKNAQRIIEIC